MQLSINPEKTEMILFTRRYKPEDVKDIKFYVWKDINPYHAGKISWCPP